jgi:hypothetical protein
MNIQVQEAQNHMFLFCSRLFLKLASPRIILIPRQPVFVLTPMLFCLVEKQQIPIL